MSLRLKLVKEHNIVFSPVFYSFDDLNSKAIVSSTPPEYNIGKSKLKSQLREMPQFTVELQFPNMLNLESCQISSEEESDGVKVKYLVDLKPWICLDSFLSWVDSDLASHYNPNDKAFVFLYKKTTANVKASIRRHMILYQHLAYSDPENEATEYHEDEATKCYEYSESECSGDFFGSI